MTPNDVTRLLEYLGAAYPTAKGEPDTALVWLQHLHETPADLASVAAHRWVEREKWMPTVADLLAECRAVTRATSTAVVPAPPVQPELAAANLAELKTSLREHLARRAAAEHWHGGPDPCRVCGGLAGTLGDQRVPV